MTELTTSVDRLMKLVEEKGKMSVSDAAKALGVSNDTAQAWVDFLVEEHILGIEYKFTTPYIYVHSKERLKAVQEDQKEMLTLSDFKETFFARARHKNMPEEKIPQLWAEHLKYVVDGQKDYFLEECNRRDVKGAETHFEGYRQELLHGA